MRSSRLMDDPSLWWEYLYEGLVASVIGVAGSVNVDTNTRKKKPKIYTPLEVMDPGDLDFDPRALFGLDKQNSSSDTAVNDLDDFDPWVALGLKNPSERENSTPETEETAKAEKKESDTTEQKFLNDLHIATESDIIQSEQQSETADTAQKPMTAQEQSAMVGEAILDMGGMPSAEQLDAMGEDKATARGAQALILLSKEDSPEEQHAVKAMIDATAPEAQQDIDATKVFDETPLYTQPENSHLNETGAADEDNADNDWDPETYTDVSGPIIRDGSHMENGKLKPNVTYQTGEHEYIYQTNENGLIVRAVAKKLKRKIHEERLPHNPKTYGKEQGDEAGHLFADQFGGSPKLDNLVSQAMQVNRVEYYALEKEWATALKKGLEVSVNIDIIYANGKTRPESFVVRYTMGEEKFSHTIQNHN